MAVDAKRYDLKLDDDGDLFISSAGDFVFAPSDEQHTDDVIRAGPCWWKQYPDNGVNIGVYANGSFDKQTLQKNIKVQLQADGYNASPKVNYSSDGGLTVNKNVN